MRTIKHSQFVAVVFALLSGVGSVVAQTVQRTTDAQPVISGSALIDSTKEYKASTQELLRLEENEASRAAAKLAQLRQLFAEGLVARREVEAAEQTLAAARAGLEARSGQVADADRLIAQMEEAEKFAVEKLAAEKSAAARVAGSPQPQVRSNRQGSYSATGVVIRYTGQTNWSVANLSAVQSFFSARFGRPLPTSAVGQTATHNRLGFDHRHAVDVALHPDSAEGRALINYLQSAGITFLAFRAAVPGSATGAHIHIGRPSHRIA